MSQADPFHVEAVEGTEHNSIQLSSPFPLIWSQMTKLPCQTAPGLLLSESAVEMTPTVMTDIESDLNELTILEQRRSPSAEAMTADMQATSAPESHQGD